MRRFAILVSLALCTSLAASGTEARTERSSAAKAAFKVAHPCPSTGADHGPCPGYVIDHIVALACGGADAPSNMQWQTVAAAKAKDTWERDGCDTSRHRQSGGNNNAYKAPSSGASTGGYFGGHHIFVGPRGGHYYINSHGKKVYVKH